MHLSWRDEPLYSQLSTSPTSHALVNYQEVDGIFRSCPLKGTSSKEWSIYINEARRTNYMTVMIGLPLIPSKPIMFSEADACPVHFPHKDTLIVTIHIDNYWVFRILISSGSSVNVLYRGAIDRMEDTQRCLELWSTLKLNPTCMGLTGVRFDILVRSYFLFALIHTMSSWSSSWLTFSSCTMWISIDLGSIWWGHSIQLPPAPAVSYPNKKRRHLGRPSSDLKHYCHNLEEIKVGGTECKDALRARPPLREETEADHCSIAITEQQKPRNWFLKYT